MRFNSLAQWLAWQETLNPAEIELGLERIDRVREAAGIADHFDCPLIIIGGTNGKGSVVAMLQSIATAAGLKVCAYTSPHISRYNERIRINGRDIDDARLCEAFERIDQARGEQPLTYFEFGTLAALDLFVRAKPDLVLLEVGLGGRLDAVNIMQPDVSVITSIDIDHTDWLGDNREAIGFEKAGIMRRNKTVICGDPEPPLTVLQHAVDQSAHLSVIGRDFHVRNTTGSWQLDAASFSLRDLPLPALAGDFQLGNAATAIMALRALQPALPIKQQHIASGLNKVQLAGRLEQLRDAPQVIVDVAHNTQAVSAIITYLKTRACGGKTRVVIAMLADKPVSAVIAQLSPLVDAWYSAGLTSVGRGLDANTMASLIQSAPEHTGDVKLCASDTVEAACAAAVHDADPDDRIIILGSFYTVAAAKQFFRPEPALPPAD
ncbi:MAG: bifunctional tetrahydrofolate synthase/dihydrofolate synthase [Gammaproteobacteria bacterium]